MIQRGDYGVNGLAPILKQSFIDKVIASLPDSKKEILFQWGDYIPDGPYTTEEKLGFVLSSIRRCSTYPVSFLVHHLVQGPPFQRLDYQAAVSEMKIYTPNVFRHLVDYYRPFKVIPDYYKSRDEFIAICALDELHDVLGAQWPGSRNLKGIVIHLAEFTRGGVSNA